MSDWNKKVAEKLEIFVKSNGIPGYSFADSKWKYSAVNAEGEIISKSYNHSQEVWDHELNWTEDIDKALELVPEDARLMLDRLSDGHGWQAFLVIEDDRFSRAAVTIPLAIVKAVMASWGFDAL